MAFSAYGLMVGSIPEQNVIALVWNDVVNEGGSLDYRWALLCTQSA